MLEFCKHVLIFNFSLLTKLEQDESIFRHFENRENMFSKIIYSILNERLFFSPSNKIRHFQMYYDIYVMNKMRSKKKIN